MRSRLKGQRSKDSKGDSPKDRKYVEWIRKRRTCVSCGAPGVLHDNGESLLHPSHVKSRGSGGGDVGNVVPQCWRCHAKFHKMGQKLFQDVYGLDLEQLAKEYYVAYCEDS